MIIWTNAPNPLACAYPLAATSSEVIALGAAGRLALSNGQQTGTYTAAGINQTYAAFPTTPTSPATIDLATGKKVIEFHFVPGSIGVVEGGQIDQDGYVSTSALSTIAAVRLRTDQNGYSLLVFRGASTVASQSISLVGGAVTAGIEFDSAAGTFRVIANGSVVSLSNDTYTGQPATVVLTTDEAAVDSSNVGETYATTARTAVNVISQTYGASATDCCGNPI